MVRAAAAEEVAELVELRRHLGRVGLVELLARVLFQEQALDRLGPRAGEVDEGDGAVAVLQRQLHADAELVAVLGAVAIGAHPLRRAPIECVQELARGRLVDEAALLVLHQPLGQRFRVELLVGRGQVEDLAFRRRRLHRPHRHFFARVGVDRVVDHLAGGAERHRLVGIAVARRERIAEPDHQQVLDRHVGIFHLAPVRQLHPDGDAGIGADLRIRHARDGELVGAGLGALARLAGCRVRLPAPRALAGAGRGAQLRRQAHMHRVRVGQDVVLLGGAPGISAVALHRVAARPADIVVAGRRIGFCRPAVPAFLVVRARRRSAGRRARRILAVGIVQAALGAPHDVGR